MNDHLNDRRIFLWHGRDLAEDTNRLTDAVAEAAVAELFELNKSVVWLSEGRPVPINKDVLREIITRHIVSVRLVNRGDDIWECEYFSFGFPLVADTSKEPNERVLIDMIAALVLRVAKGPSEPVRLSEQQQREIHARLKMNEPKARIAASYKVDVATIEQMAR